MYPWKTIIHIDREVNTPVFVQIVNAIINEVMNGRIVAAQKLPGTRAMSSLIGVNRKTVEIAYDELMAQGWVEILPSRGAFISEALPMVKYKRIAEPLKELTIANSTGYEIEELWDVSNIHPPRDYQFEIDDGTPDSRLAPLPELLKVMRRIIEDPANSRLLHYTSSQGESSFRDTLSDFLRETRGLVCGPENIFISRGTQMGLFLIFNVLLSRGDKVIVGDSSYPSADNAIKHIGGELVRIKMDEKGLDVDEVERVCRKQKIRAMYITPHHHFPTTVTLSAERRVKLSEIAEKYDLAIIEDDYDYDFHYSGNPILPLASMDSSGRVIYVGSFSKLLSPNVRIGYVVAPHNLIVELNKLRRIVEIQGDPVLEKAIGEMINRGLVQRHQKVAVKVYRERRDNFCQLLSEFLDDYVDFEIPNGGMAVWSKFKREVNIQQLSSDLLQEGIFLNVNLDFIPKFNALRLGFASLETADAAAAIASLARALNKNSGSRAAI